MNNPWTMGDDAKMFSRRQWARLAERRHRRAIACSWEAQVNHQIMGKMRGNDDEPVDGMG